MYLIQCNLKRHSRHQTRVPQMIFSLAFQLCTILEPHHWSYTIKVDTNLCAIICLRRHKNERTFMSGFKRYDEDFKQSLVNLYQTGKTQAELCKDYGVSASALAKWIKQYSQGFCCKVFQKIYFSVKLRKKTEKTE